LRALVKAMRVAPDDALALYNRGTAYANLGEFDLAIADFSEALRLCPTSILAYHNRGYAYAGKKDYERAVADYRAAFLLDPDDAVACNSLAWLWAVCPKEDIRNGTAALAAARRACRLTGWKNGNYLSTLAAAYAECGQFKKALTFEEKALKDRGYASANRREAQLRLDLYKRQEPYREH
jgi:tetratricopeptide (TPR) repeat protein